MKSFKFYGEIFTLLLVSMVLYSCEDEKDNSPDIRPDSLEIAVANDFEASYGETVQLDGSRTEDKSGALISYKWEAVSFPGDHFAPSILEQEDSPIAMFTPEAIGDFVFQLTASTEFEKKTATISVKVDAQTIEVGGTISDATETWGKTTPKGIPDYRVTSTILLRRSNITVLPGVEIEMTESTGVNVEANSFFKLEGTEEEPIIIQGAENTKGYWSSIRWMSGSSNNKMIHVKVSDGGRRRNNDRGMITFGHDGSLHIENCHINNAENAGLELGIVATRTNLKITHIANDYKDNERPVSSRADYFHVLDADSDYSGNEVDIIDSRFGFGIPPIENLTWQKLNVSYLTGGVDIRGELNIQAGTVVKVGGNSNKYIRTSMNGTLKVVGTSDDPVIIEGAVSGSGTWLGIFLNSSGSNSISHAVISGTGSGSQTSGAELAAVFVRNSSLDLDNTTFKDGNGFGFATWGGARLVNVGDNVTIQNMALGLTNMD